MRAWLIHELVQDIYGPTNIFENIPNLEYSIGIIRGEKEDSKKISKKELVDKGLSGEDTDEGQDTNVHVYEHPSLNPSDKANSFGLSFTVTEPQFDLVCTWGIYQENKNSIEETIDSYQRVPFALNLSWHELQELVQEEKTVHPFSMKFKQVKEYEIGFVEKVLKNEEQDVQLYLYCKKSKDGSFVISIFLQNSSSYSFYQPEIRVCFKGDCQFHSKALFDTSDNPSEKGETEYLYRDRLEKGRGHLCSVVWEDFDPQAMILNKEELSQEVIAKEGKTEQVEFSKKAPFYWIDGDHPELSEIQKKFRTPNIRTDFLPMVSIPAPDRNPWGKEVILKAKDLAQASIESEIRVLIEPLLTKYESWIESSFDSSSIIENKLKNKAKSVLNRMKLGLELLCSDDEVRLAFNLANKAVNLNMIWGLERKGKDISKEDGIKWYAFQLGFVLLTLESLANPDSDAREEVDLLWVATGGGKTEAYLLLSAFLLALRRLKPDMTNSVLNNPDSKDPSYDILHGHGCAVITRYTLRLLTIQQFRRALGIITSLEYLRNSKRGNGFYGWLPSNYEGGYSSLQHCWGLAPFSIGIWVGGSVTPNKLSTTEIVNYPKKTQPDITDAIQLLHYSYKNTSSEPAQLLNCPCCFEILSVPIGSENSGQEKNKKIHWIIRTNAHKQDIEDSLEDCSNDVYDVSLESLISHSYEIKTLTVLVSSEAEQKFDERFFEDLWTDIKRNLLGNNIELLSARASRPGYFLRTYKQKSKKAIRQVAYDYDIFCPNPKCKLNLDIEYMSAMPKGSIHNRRGNETGIKHDKHGYYVDVVDAFRLDGQVNVARGIPITAYTCDEQIYRRAPSIIIATVDKFARLPYMASASAIFGNVTHHSSYSGFFRLGADQENPEQKPKHSNNAKDFSSFRLRAPELIIQDELHLISGPLGSMVGFYETLVEGLINEGLNEEGRENGTKVKYIASTATISSAQKQIQCLFAREKTVTFPPKGSTWSDRGLIKEYTNKEALSASADVTTKRDDVPIAGRLYLGISPIGISGLGMTRDVIANVTHNGARLANQEDYAYTFVGYFNAIKELAAARALVEQDVKGRLEKLMSRDGLLNRRSLDNLIELSSRMKSTELPSMLDRLENKERGDSSVVDILLTTSMFGTGVDVNRLNIMLVSGQPKTTAQYIQATGRVGRSKGALVLPFLRASRPRDLDHYERFLNYHLQQARWVEPVTIRPFSISVIDRALGPLYVAWLRHSRLTDKDWTYKKATNGIESEGVSKFLLKETMSFYKLIYQRNLAQPKLFRINYKSPNWLKQKLQKCIEHWKKILEDVNNHNEQQEKEAKAQGRAVGREELCSLDWSLKENIYNPKSRSFVVLGTEKHLHSLKNAHNAVFGDEFPSPQSLRSVDAQITVREASKKRK